ncbi:MAG: SRPBCC domain-containing protein [Rhizobacter sp.]|nr:SRPBCC domain-containing protein [Rhizobacter sp.]
MSHQTQVSLERPERIVTSRIFEAPRELAWRAFTESGQVEPWCGPLGFTTTTEVMEVRAGGQWRHTMHGPDGRDYPNLIEYSANAGDGHG